MRKQRATLTLVDEGGGFRATVQYQPSVKGRTIGENSPSINAMVRLCLIIARAKDTIAQPLVQTPQPTKRLTIKDKVLGFLNGLCQERNANPPASVVETPARLEEGVLEEGAPQMEKGNNK